MFRSKAEAGGEEGVGNKAMDTAGGVSLGEVPTIVQHFEMLNVRVKKLLDAIDTLKKFHLYVIKISYTYFVTVIGCIEQHCIQ